MGRGKFPLQVARVVLAILAVAAMIPLSFFGYLMGGALGGDVAESTLGPAHGLAGVVVGSVVMGGASLLLPALVALWIDKILKRRFGGARHGKLQP